MKTKRTPGSVKIIYWITQVLFWLFTAAALFAVLFTIGMSLNLLKDFKLSMGLPVEMEVVETGEFTLGEQTLSVQLKEMIGKIEFKKPPILLQRLYGVFVLIILSITYYLFMTFRSFITQVYKGFYFERKNILLLKRISYGLIGIWIFIVFYAFFQYFFIVKRLNFESMIVQGKIETYPSILVFALIVWVLSHIFQKGVELQNENELTI